MKRISIKVIGIGVIVLLAILVFSTMSIQTPEEKLEKEEIIPGLVSISTAAMSVNWDADPEEDGLVVELCFKNGKGDIIFFQDVPVDVTVRLYTQKLNKTTFEYYQDRLVYEGSFRITSWEDTCPFGGDRKIKIPFEEIKVNPGLDYQFGIIEITAHTPKQGDFKDRTIGIKLYP